MRILFAGTPMIALPALTTAAKEFEVAGVLTVPDKAQGRGKKIAHSPVKAKALELGLPVLQPACLDQKTREHISGLNCDLLVVFAFSTIFDPEFLALFKKGGINIHPSLLPKYRGPSPITAAILHGDKETGICVQTIVPEVDAGNVLASRPVKLCGNETTTSLTQVMARKGAELLAKVLHEIAAGRCQPVPQDHKAATYCYRIEKKDALIKWGKSAENIERMVRAYIPWPKARTTLQGKNLIILKAALYTAPPAPAAYSTSQAPGAQNAEGGTGPNINSTLKHDNHANDKEADVGKGPTSDKNKGGNKVPGKVIGIDKEAGILVQTGSGILVLKELQLETKKALPWCEFIKGTANMVGSVLGDVS